MAMRFLYIAALIAGASFYFHDAVRIPFALDLVWKASGCALLALWAASRARNPDGWLLALAFAVYALADAMLDLAGLVGGAAAFIVGHLIMIAIYWRNRRPVIGETRWMAVLIMLAVPLVAVALPAQAADRLLVLPYAVVLGIMAAAAAISRFPRDRVLAGALCFVMSDWLIFAKTGALAHSAIPDIGIWPLYFAGQALIAAGVAHGLERRR
jgi:uncharacterized membrane protein YhhN